MHTGAGMVGMMVVKPKGLPPVDRELWMTQQEYYIGKPGQDADMAKMQAKKPDVIAFNGYANQYKDNPITVKRGERIRMYVLNARPEHLVGLPRHRHRLRPHRRSRARSATTRRRSTSRRRRAAGSSSRSTRRAPTPSSPTPSATRSRARIGVLQTENAPAGAPATTMGAPQRRRDRRRPPRPTRTSRSATCGSSRDVPSRQGRRGHLLGQERGRDDARPGDREGAGRRSSGGMIDHEHAALPAARTSPAARARRSPPT